MDLELTDRVGVVAGAPSAERDACATRLRAEGAVVVVADRLADALRTVEAAIGSYGRVDVVIAVLPDDGPRSIHGTDLEALYGSWDAIGHTAAAFGRGVRDMSGRGWGRLVSVTTAAVKSVGDDMDELAVLTGLGVLGMHKSAVADIAGDGIATNAVLRDRTADPDEVAAAVAFLCSNRAGYLQGVTLALDGATGAAMF